VHRVTIHRRWRSAYGVLADVLSHLTPIEPRGQASREIDPLHAIESTRGPIYLRLLVTRQPIDQEFRDVSLACALRLIRPHLP
jgi:hypothetical protein